MRLRIVAGKYKGRFISAPQLKTTRPTTEKVKESLFNMLTNEYDFDGFRVLDLYAGSGSLGFEALSRGASSVCFVENNFIAVKNLKENIDSLKCSDSVEVVKANAASFVKNYSGEPFDLILADPPFFKYDIYDTVKTIIEKKILADEGIFIIERSIQTETEDKTEFGIEPFKRIGDTLLYRIEHK